MYTTKTTKRPAHGYAVKVVATAQGRLYTVVNSGGDPLYTFIDQRSADAEAAILNEWRDVLTVRARSAPTWGARPASSRL